MTELGDVMKRSADWLLKRQDSTSGGWASRAGRVVSTLNTAETIIALLDGDVVAAGDNRIRQGVQFLLKHQFKEGSDVGTWPREVLGDQGEPYQIPDMVRTSFGIQALIKAGTGIDEDPIKNAVDWLLGLRNTDNGWGYRRNSTSGSIPTCFALMALMEAYRAGMDQCKQSIINGLEFLVEKCGNEDGSFGNPGPLRAVHTIYATLVLQAARRCQLSPYLAKEKGAIGWLLEHPDDARKLVEERVTIDPSGRFDYGFLFMTDSLLIKVLTGSEFKEHRNSGLAREAMISLRDKMDESGGFYGYRVFSWSTAKVLSALGMVRSQYQEFPNRNPEYSGPKAGNFLFGFAILVSVAVVYLTVEDRFQLLHAAIFIFLMLALLLAYGRIGEKTFKELVQGVFNILKKR